MRGIYWAGGRGLLAGLVTVWSMVTAALPSDRRSTACSEIDADVEATEQEPVKLVCRAAKDAVATLASCGLQQTRRIVIRIAVAADDPPTDQSYGCYDHTTGLITLAGLAACTQRLRRDESRAHIDPDEYYRSVVIHEVTHSILLAHPASDHLSRPAQEYLAYALQIDAFSDASRAEFLKPYRENRALRTLMPDEILLHMNPSAFGAMSYLHFKMLGERCDAIKRVLKGEIEFTRPYE
ncbi:MAG: DUF6639 family protein [Hyphomicrobiaceae bacterium]|nr:DUF6639 family protein [Hyphomicrobiaceae bacterium]